MSIALHIERLVVDHALLGGERPAAVNAAIRRELSRRLAQPGVAADLRGLETVASLPPIALPAAPARDRIGPRIAAATLLGLGIAEEPHADGQGR